MRSHSMSALFLLSAMLLALPASALDGGVENLRQTGKAFASVARSVSPSVVFIQVEARLDKSGMESFSNPFREEWPFGDEMFKRFFGDRFPGLPERSRPYSPRSEQRSIGQGSGFVFAVKDGLLSDKTFILTNNHVVENAEKIQVKFQDGRTFDARVTGRDPQSDVAVIEIESGNLPALEWGDSSQLDVGEWVVAIGNPFGLSHTLTVGVVSAKGRTGVGINDYEDFIQTDAAINPGNSGGPLVNLNGEVVGINTAIFSRSGGYMGVGFAIPSNLARGIANQLIERGVVTRGFLGIVIQQLTPELAESFGIDPGKGILVSYVSEDSPAERAGLRQGDVILSYRNKPVNDVGGFRNQVSMTLPGSREELTILRNGRRMSLTATIGELTPDKLVVQSQAQRVDETGMTVQTLTPQLAEQFDARPGEGVVVTEVRPGSVAALAGIEPGSILLQVNRNPVNSAEEFARLMKEYSRDKRVLLLLRKGEMQRYLVLSW